MSFRRKPILMGRAPIATILARVRVSFLAEWLKYLYVDPLANVRHRTAAGSVHGGDVMASDKKTGRTTRAANSSTR